MGVVFSTGLKLLSHVENTKQHILWQ